MIWWTLHRLKSKNKDVRISAARKLGELRVGKAVPALLGALDDSDAGVRVAAAKALASIPHAAAIEPLASAIEHAAGTQLGKTETSLEEYKALAEAIAVQGKDAMQPLSRLLTSSHHGARLWAAWALGRIGGPQAAAALAGILDDRRSEVRQQAAASLGEIADPAGVSALAKAISHRDPDTRRAAAMALSAFCDEQALQALEHATRDLDEGVQRAAVASLARMGTVAAALRLKTAVESERKAVREEALEAVRSPLLKPQDAKEAVALAAVRGDYAAAAIEGEVALPALIEALKSKDADRRLGAVRGLERLRSVDAIPSLVHALRDPVGAVRDSVENALVAVGLPAGGALVVALSSEDVAVQRHAAAVLGRIGDNRAVAGLVSVIVQNRRSPAGFDGPAEAARSAAEALKLILQSHGGSLSEEELRGLCDVPDAVVEKPSPDDPYITLDETVVDCTPLRSLAKRELSRRLGWA